jgi:hypothetical protein
MTACYYAAAAAAAAAGPTCCERLSWSRCRLRIRGRASSTCVELASCSVGDLGFYSRASRNTPLKRRLVPPNCCVASCENYSLAELLVGKTHAPFRTSLPLAVHSCSLRRHARPARVANQHRPLPNPVARPLPRRNNDAREYDADPPTTMEQVSGIKWLATCTSCSAMRGTSSASPFLILHRPAKQPHQERKRQVKVNRNIRRRATPVHDTHTCL